MEKKICSICLEEITSKDNIKTLKCKHVFHKNCIRKWYTTKDADRYDGDCYKVGECPNCRNKSEELFICEIGEPGFQLYNNENTSTRKKIYIISRRLLSGFLNKFYRT